MSQPQRLPGRAFAAAALVPCAILLLFCAVAVHEWWLIKSGQIAVIPTPKPGQGGSVPDVPAASLLPLIIGSAALAAAFGWAFWRRSQATLAVAYLVLILLAAAPIVKRML